MHTPEQIIKRIKSVLRAKRCHMYMAPECLYGFQIFTAQLGEFDVQVSETELVLSCPDHAGLFFACEYTKDFPSTMDGLDLTFQLQHTLDYQAAV